MSDPARERSPPCRLQQQKPSRSCSNLELNHKYSKATLILAMDIVNCCNSGRKIRLHRQDFDDNIQISYPGSSSSSCFRSSKQLGWKVLWMKLKKEKRKLFDPPIPLVPYDAYTYSQNFDHELSWDDPDNLSRSFSVRFANPSIVLVTENVVVN